MVSITSNTKDFPRRRVLIAGEGRLFEAFLLLLAAEASFMAKNRVSVCRFRSRSKRVPSGLSSLSRPRPERGFNDEMNRQALLANSEGPFDLLLLVSWGEILSAETLEQLDAASCVVWNLHPSLLPAYRGPNPYYWQILDHVSVSGLTLHRVDSGIDTGDIVLQSSPVALSPQETGETLREKLVGVLPEFTAFLAHQDDAVNAPRQVQDASMAFYRGQPTVVEQLRIDWHVPVDVLSRNCRAAWPWYPLWTSCNGLAIGFASARVTALFDAAALATLPPPKPGQVLRRTWRQVFVATASPEHMVVLSRPFLLQRSALESALLLPFLLGKGACCH